MDRASADRFRRADSVFDAALDVASDERPAFVERACAGDAELVTAVERLLRARDRADGFLSVPAAELAAPMIAEERLEVADVPTTPPNRIGSYRIVREIGRGGMGVVYLAERDDPHFQQRIALKVVRDGVPDGQAHVTRFLAERQFLASLEHPHIARLFDGGVTTDGLPYYTMAFCEGGSLADRLRAKRALSIAEALRIARELATALGAAHARGIVHRDVKPGNVLFDADGAVRLSDFGVAKLLDEKGTRSGAVLGTVAYLAPEQVRGESIDHRTDLWALGVTLYEMLAGCRPFGGPSYAAVMHAIDSVAPHPLRLRVTAIPPAIDALVMQLLEKAPASRPASAAEIIRLLDQATVAGRADPPRNGRWGRQLRVGVGIATLGALGAAGYVAWRRLTVLPTPASAAATIKSVAVLPFENSVGIPDDDPIVDGFTDELIGLVGKVRGLRVTPRPSAFALRQSSLGSRAKADALNVEYLVEGGVRHGGTRYVVFAQLVRPRDGSVLWTQTYHGEWKEVFAVQPTIARDVARALRVDFALPDPPRPSSDSAARNLYRLGRAALYARNGPADFRRVETYFTEAIAHDSMYARAYSGLSDVYTSLSNFGYERPAGARAKARAYAERALRLDSTLAEARTSLGHILCTQDFEWAAGERELLRATKEDPTYMYARTILAICLETQGRFAEAIAQLDTVETQDPLWFGPGGVRGRVYVNAGRPDDAIRVLTETTRLNPQADLSWQQLGQAYLLKGMGAEAISALRTAARLSGARDSAQLAYAYAVTGDRATAKHILRALLGSRNRRYVPPFHIAMAYAGLGQKNDAFDWLDLAFDERASFLNGVKVDPAFKTLHGDPRWWGLLGRMGLAIDIPELTPSPRISKD